MKTWDPVAMGGFFVELTDEVELGVMVVETLGIIDELGWEVMAVQ
jgi:hypothetical protein